VDPKLIRELKRLAVGVGMKTIGYLLIAVGIFLPLVNKKMGYTAVYAGLILVVAGWVYIYVALKKSGKIKKPT
jgi:uncharacterized membrane protein